MILKVHDADKGEWTFYGGVERCTVGKAFLRMNTYTRGEPILRICRTEEQQDLPAGAEDSDTIFTDFSIIPTHWRKDITEGKRTTAQVNVALLQMEGMRHMTIAFGSTGFLMNDDGKTIERL